MFRLFRPSRTYGYSEGENRGQEIHRLDLKGSEGGIL